MVAAPLDLRHSVSSLPDTAGITVGTNWPILAVRSLDGGRTWSQPVQIAAPPGYFGARDASSGEQVRTEPTPSTALAPDGSVYVAWSQIESDGSSQVLVSRSIDDGASWTPPRAIKSEHTQAFTPTLAVMPDGTRGVTYFDFRHDVPSSGHLTTDYWLSYSRDHGNRWRELHLAGPFDARKVPSTSIGGEIPGHFLGEYEGLTRRHPASPASFRSRSASRPEDQRTSSSAHRPPP